MSKIVGKHTGDIPGTVRSWSGATVPKGWLLCNGNTIPNGVGTVQGITANFSVFIFSKLELITAAQDSSLM
jgi:hypothetical protein